MNWKNKLLLALTKILSPSKNRPQHRFLVISTTALGDALWATPALQALRTSFPNSYIVLLASPIGEQALRNNPWCDKLLVTEDPLLPKFFSLWKLLRKETIDTVLYFHASQRLMLPLCSLIGASRIVATAGINKGLDALVTDPLENRQKHEIVRRLEIVEKVGAKRGEETLSFFLTPEEKEAAPSLPAGKWVALHPGSKDNFKRWPEEHFIAVGKKLREKGFQILITGNQSEEELMKRIAFAIPGANLADTRASLRSFAALLTKIDLLISNDTGPVHLASALNTPTLALYSPTDPRLCGPHAAPKTRPLFQPPCCDSCLKRKCLRPFCLLQIGPEEVVNQAANMIEG